MRYLKALTIAVTDLWLWFTYRLTMWRLGVSEEYIRKAFSALTEMDLDEFKYVEVESGNLFHSLELKAWGNEVHIKTVVDKGKNPYQCVIKEGIRKDVYVDEWREETREVILEYGAKHKTHWWEVYRTGRWIRSTRFVDYLKILYGEKIHAIPQQGSAGLDVRKPSADGEDVRPTHSEFGAFATARRASSAESGSGTADASERSGGTSPEKLRVSDELPGPEQT